MAYQALYRKWRPQTFADVVGQDHICRTLKNEITTGRIGHAYLFCGSRGTGKTSTARIFSRALNCQNSQNGDPCNQCEACRGILSGEFLDVVEIDAASNNGVDNIRDLCDEAKYQAAFVKFKVFIIDEVHMLSTGAFNALLKMLEEPPEHVIFILATTEVQKVLPTILSRCQRFDFRRITAADIAAKLADICQREGAEYEDEALALIAQEADGGLRDALSMLDMCMAAGGGVTLSAATQILGVTPRSFFSKVAKCVLNGDAAGAMACVDEFIARGQNPALLADGFIKYLRDLLLLRVSPQTVEVVEAAGAELADMKAIAAAFAPQRLVQCATLMMDMASKVRYMGSARVLLEVALLKMCLPGYDDSSEGVAARLAQLEQKIESGAFMQGAPAAKAQKGPAAKPEAQKKAPPKEKLTPQQLSEQLEKVKLGWGDVLRAASEESVGIFIALQQCRLEFDGGKAVLVANDIDAACLTILKNGYDELLRLVENATGQRPDFAFRTQSPKKQQEDEGDRLDELESFLNSLETQQ